MLGAFAAASPAHAVSNFVFEKGFENAYVVDERQRLCFEVDQSDWRKLLAGGIDDRQPLSSLQQSYDRVANMAGSPITSFRQTERPWVEGVIQAFGSDCVLVDTRAVYPFVSPKKAYGLIMAGGFGSRLGSLTKTVPKPMLHVGGRPIAERLLENLLESGITDVFMSLHYLPHVVRSHFAGGESFGARVNYLEEATPLGTAGCLSLLPRDIDRPVIMVNGDVVTDARLGRVLDFHTAADHDVTVCVRPYVVPIPFGVVDQCNGVVTGIREKPQLVYSVNVAIYVLSPRVLAKVPANARLDMPTFIESLIRDGDRVGAFPLVENWIDVGTPAELERARHEFRNTAVSQSQLACA